MAAPAASCFQSLNAAPPRPGRHAFPQALAIGQQETSGALAVWRTSLKKVRVPRSGVVVTEQTMAIRRGGVRGRTDLVPAPGGGRRGCPRNPNPAIPRRSAAAASADRRFDLQADDRGRTVSRRPRVVCAGGAGGFSGRRPSGSTTPMAREAGNRRGAGEHSRAGWCPTGSCGEPGGERTRTADQQRQPRGSIP